jgi:hypothetical protein
MTHAKSHLTRNLSILAGLFLAVGCGFQAEDELISDRELDAVQYEASQSALTSTSPAAPGALHLRLAWGYLAGNREAPVALNWTGGLTLDSGRLALEHVTFFDRRDRPVPTEAGNQLSWSSRTLPHFDGVVVRVDPDVNARSITFATSAFTKELSLQALRAGQLEVIDVDRVGHELSIAAVPESSCSGFVLGYERPSEEGWLGFAGVLMDRTGKPQGFLRFRADEGVVTARVFGMDRQLVATGEGRLEGDRFTIAVTLPDGIARQVSGQYRAPSYSARGSFQGTTACP